MQLNALQQQCGYDSERYFPGLEQDIEYHLICLGGEVGEMMNLWKKYKRGGTSRFIKDLKDEMPDVLIYLCTLANALEIDLENYYTRKRQINNARFLR